MQAGPGGRSSTASRHNRSGRSRSRHPIPTVIYVASGEGLHRPDLSVGNGIYRSDDGGRSWSHLGLTDGQQIAQLALDPRDPNRLFAAVLGHPYGPNAERGIYRSLDAGVSWQRVLYRDADTGGSAVAIDPAHSRGRLRGAVAVAPRSVGGQERVRGHRRRAVQVHRRRQHLEAAEHRPADGSVADQHRDRAEQPAARCMPRWPPTSPATTPRQPGSACFAPTTPARAGCASPPIRGRRCASAAAICR